MINTKIYITDPASELYFKNHSRNIVQKLELKSFSVYGEATYILNVCCFTIHTERLEL